MGNFSGRDVASLLDFFQGVVMATDLRRVEIEKKSGYGASDVKGTGGGGGGGGNQNGDRVVGVLEDGGGGGVGGGGGSNLSVEISLEIVSVVSSAYSRDRSPPLTAI